MFFIEDIEILILECIDVKIMRLFCMCYYKLIMFVEWSMDMVWLIVNLLIWFILLDNGVYIVDIVCYDGYI